MLKAIHFIQKLKILRFDLTQECEDETYKSDFGLRATHILLTTVVLTRLVSCFRNS